jgi:beta-lactamase regulating signal transducer with metallopeptidase domain
LAIAFSEYHQISGSHKMKMNTHGIRMPNWFWSPKNTYTLSWIRFFINETEYNNREMKPDCTHTNSAHANPKKTPRWYFTIHRLWKPFFWFNPKHFFYKKSIQLKSNEFLADEKVVKSYNNVPFYQTLLLSKANENPTFTCINLNYLITKKRLIMMTKTTSK